LYCWLEQVSQKKIKPVLIVTLGCVAGVALIVYTVTLGAVGEPYALARRTGVVLYFAFSSFAHLLLLSKLAQIDTKGLNIEGEQKVLFTICVILVTSAILSALAGFLWAGWDDWENAYEWWFSLLMIMLFYVVGKMWRKTQFCFTLRLGVSK
jgi:phosphoglycerol transferase MdoB-like AlkP superfamily enzyme